MSKTTSNKRWMVQSLLRMAEITEDEMKRSEYLQEVEEIMTEMKEQSYQLQEYGHKDAHLNSFIEYLEEKNIKIAGKSVQDIYTAYIGFCEWEGHVKLAKNEFSKRLQRQLSLETVVTKVDGKAMRIYHEVVEE